jgi:putative ABC transport system permease protein
MTDAWANVRHALRSFHRQPGSRTATVLVLGVGVGAVSLIFSILNAVVLQPLPFPHPDRLVWLSSLTPSGNPNSTSFADYRDFRDRSEAFESLGAYMLFGQARILTGGDNAERVTTYLVTANLFSTLGVPPEIGRAFRPDEEQTGQDQVAILSHAFWLRHHGGDARAVGSNLTLDGQSIRIVGVMPPGFDFPSGGDLWLPAQEAAGYASGRNNNNFLVLGRLRAGVSLLGAQARADVVARNIADAFPDTKRGWGVRLESLHEHFFGPARSTILTLMAIVSLVPLVACANVALLLLARGLSRRGEFATRLALGASRGRLVRQLMSESLVVALAGGAVGAVLAYLGGDVLRAAAPAALPRLDAIRVDGAVLVFTLVVSLTLVPLFGVVPALRSTDIGIAEELKAGGGRAIGGGRSRVRGALVVAQVALSVILLFGSALLLESFLALQRADPGFRADNLLTFQAQLPVYRYTSREEAQQAWDAVRGRLLALPGVRAVGAVDRLPVGVGAGPWNEVWAREHPPASTAEARGATRRFTTEGFFAALGVAVRDGRAFEHADFRGSGLVTVVNETLAREFFPGVNPVGHFLMLPWGDPPLALQVLGVMADVSELGVGTEPTPTFYLPTVPQRGPQTTLYVLVRTAGDPLALVGSVRQALREVHPDIPMSQVATMRARLSATLLPPRFRATMVAVFALISLLLSAMGLYGMLAYFVREHRRAIGIRLALGAGTGAVRRLVMARGMTLVASGCLIGAAAGLIAARVIASRGWLFGVGAGDPLSLAAVVVCLGLVALVACLLPADRAARVNPIEVMQAE